LIQRERNICNAKLRQRSVDEIEEEYESIPSDSDAQILSLSKIRKGGREGEYELFLMKSNGIGVGEAELNWNVQGVGGSRRRGRGSSRTKSDMPIATSAFNPIIIIE
jgi:hypothetical protein